MSSEGRGVPLTPLSAAALAAPRNDWFEEFPVRGSAHAIAVAAIAATAVSVASIRLVIDGPIVARVNHGVIQPPLIARWGGVRFRPHHAQLGSLGEGHRNRPVRPPG